MSQSLAQWIAAEVAWRNDGHPHDRDADGFCTTCGATANEYHYSCSPRKAT